MSPRITEGVPDDANPSDNHKAVGKYVQEILWRDLHRETGSSVADSDRATLVGSRVIKKFSAH